MANAIGLSVTNGDSGKPNPLASGYLPGEPSMWFFIIGD